MAAFHATGAPQSCPTMTALFLAQGAHEADDIADQVELRISVEVGGRVGASVAALVRRDRAISPFCKRRKLMPPGVPGLREAVAEDHERTLAGLGDMHVDAVRLYDAVVDLVQGLASLVDAQPL